MLTRRKETTLIPAAGYVRMSTDQQEDSPERQRSEIIEIADRNGYEIIRWYEDHGLTGTKSKNRPQFQQMLKDAPSGDFSAVLMHEQSRFSRETMLQFASHLNSLNEVGVDLVTRKGKIAPDDIGGFITAMIDQHGARQEAENIGHRTASGKRQKLLKTGGWFGASPFGYDREVIDQNGKVVTVVRYEEKFARSTQHTCRLVPSDPKRVWAVRQVFEKFIAGNSIRSIAVWLNESGFQTRHGRTWEFGAVKHMLQNPAYCGRIVAARNQDKRTQFSKMFEEMTVIAEDAHSQIVNREMFDQVQALMAGRNDGRFRGPRETHILSGLVVCGVCGRKAYGAAARNGSGDRVSYYRCVVKKANREDSGCITMTGHILERAVLNVIKEEVLTDENLQKCEAAHAAMQKKPKASQQKRIAELERRIKTGESNLALAESPSDFATVSEMLRSWRKDLASLRKVDNASMSPVRSIELQTLKSCRDELESADKVVLFDALRQTIEAILIKRGADRNSREAQVVFKPGVYAGGEINIPASRMQFSNRVRQIAEFAKDCGGVAIDDIAERFRIKPRTARGYVSKAVKQGLMKQDGCRWIAED